METSSFNLFGCVKPCVLNGITVNHKHISYFSEDQELCLGPIKPVTFDLDT